MESKDVVRGVVSHPQIFEDVLTEDAGQAGGGVLGRCYPDVHVVVVNGGAVGADNGDGRGFGEAPRVTGCAGDDERVFELRVGQVGKNGGVGMDSGGV